MLPRRALLIGGVASAAVLAGGGLTASGGRRSAPRPPARQSSSACVVDGSVPKATGSRVRRGQFASARRGQRVGWVLITPAGVPPKGLPTVLVLHGRTGSAASCVRDLAYDQFLAAHVAAGQAPLALAAIDGGDRYWHPRQDGDDPLGMLLDEFLPRLADWGLDATRMGVTGWSMGGYASLLLARESERGLLGGVRVVAAAASSPALFPSFEATRPGAFDGPADFAVWGDLLDDPGVRPRSAGGPALRVDCGEADAFRSVTRAYRDVVPSVPEGGIGPGCHDRTYWRSIAAAQLRFLAEQLATTA